MKPTEIVHQELDPDPDPFFPNADPDPDPHQYYADPQHWFLPCPFHVPSMFLQCSFNVPSMFLQCSFNVPLMFLQCSFNVPLMFPHCSLNVLSIFLLLFLSKFFFSRSFTFVKKLCWWYIKILYNFNHFNCNEPNIILINSVIGFLEAVQISLVCQNSRLKTHIIVKFKKGIEVKGTFKPNRQLLIFK